MKLRFYGADRCVTGSCHCLEVNGKHILVDCGLQQGRDEIDNTALPFHPGSIDVVLVTHAHIDHSGRIPMLIKNGFQGKIITTRLTADLLDIMLQDSAHIQEQDAEYQNRKNKRAGRPEVEPIYTVADALRVREFIQTCEYGQDIPVVEGVTAQFIDAGHLLGSASIKLTCHEGDETRTVVFSGDIGNVDQPIIRDPQFFDSADYVLTESTYGDRNHTEVWSYTGQLAEIIDETLGKGGNVVIPPSPWAAPRSCCISSARSRTKIWSRPSRTSRCTWTARWPRRPPRFSAAICGAIWMRTLWRWCRTAPICSASPACT